MHRLQAALATWGTRRRGLHHIPTHGADLAAQTVPRLRLDRAVLPGASSQGTHLCLPSAGGLCAPRDGTTALLFPVPR